MPCPVTSLPLRSLNHLSRVARDVRVSADFYRDVLGFFEIKRPSAFDFEGAWWVRVCVLVCGGLGPVLAPSCCRTSTQALQTAAPCVSSLTPPPPAAARTFHTRSDRLFNYGIGIHLIKGEPVARGAAINPKSDHVSFQVGRGEGGAYCLGKEGKWGGDYEPSHTPSAASPRWHGAWDARGACE